MKALLSTASLVALLCASHAAAADELPSRQELERQRDNLVKTRGLAVVGIAAGALVFGGGIYLAERASNRESEGDTCFDCVGDIIAGVGLATLGVSLAVSSTVAFAIIQVSIGNVDQSLQVAVVPGPETQRLMLSGRF